MTILKYLKVILQNIIVEYLILIRKPAGLIFALFLPTIILVVFGISFPGETLDITYPRIVIIEDENNQTLVSSLKEKISPEDFNLEVRRGDQSTLEELVKSKEYLLGIYPELSLSHQPPKITIVVDNSNPLARDTVLDKVMPQIVEIEDSFILQKDAYEKDLRFIDYLFPGITAFGIMFFCLSLASIGVVRERISGSLERIRSSPLPLWVFLISKYTAYSLLAAIAGVLILIGGRFLFNISIAGPIWLVILLEILGAAPFIGLALITSTIGRSEFEAQVIILFISLPLVFISGIFFPIQCMPDYVQNVVKFFPLTYSVEGLRDVIIRDLGLFEILPVLNMLILYSLLFFIFAVLIFRKRER
ncbi:MAG: ABC transporter permease [Candidatus Paceibacterales bacterium]